MIQVTHLANFQARRFATLFCFVRLVRVYSVVWFQNFGSCIRNINSDIVPDSSEFHFSEIKSSILPQFSPASIRSLIASSHLSFLCLSQRFSSLPRYKDIFLLPCYGSCIGIDIYTLVWFDHREMKILAFPMNATK